jgi:hypothetical protein
LIPEPKTDEETRTALLLRPMAVRAWRRPVSAADLLDKYDKFPNPP